MTLSYKQTVTVKYSTNKAAESLCARAISKLAPMDVPAVYAAKISLYALLSLLHSKSLFSITEPGMLRPLSS